MKACAGSGCDIPLRAIPTITNARRNLSITNGEQNRHRSANIDNQPVFADLREIKLGKFV